MYPGITGRMVMPRLLQGTPGITIVNTSRAGITRGTPGLNGVVLLATVTITIRPGPTAVSFTGTGTGVIWFYPLITMGPI